MSNVDIAIDLVRKASSDKSLTKDGFSALVKSVAELKEKSNHGDAMMIGLVTGEPLFYLGRRLAGDKKPVDSPPAS